MTTHGTTPAVTLVGHPFAPMGMGEHLRSGFRALRTAGSEVSVRDVYALAPRTDSRLRAELNSRLVDTLNSQVNVFHINADEVKQAVAHIGGSLPRTATNVIYPLWELPRFPAVWRPQLELFDEIWAPSKFVYDAIAGSVSRPVRHMPLACEVRMSRFVGRRSFGIPEGDYVFLFFFDFSSYLSRKNPFAVLEVFRRLLKQLPRANVRLVLKTHRGQHQESDYEKFRDSLREIPDRVTCIDRTLDDDEIKNLIRCSDCFVSLHRSEGFGFGMCEAMYLGKPVVGTAFSGNLDFMNEANSCLVRHSLIPVGEGEYPHAAGQVWAEPDLDHAAWHMQRLVEDAHLGRRIGEVASRHIRTHFSYRACGLRYTDRMREFADEPQRLEAIAG